MATFGQILDAVLAANLERQVASDRNRAFLSREQWIQEYCTIGLSYGRQTGKTYAIGKRATSKDLVITFNSGMMKNFMESKTYFPTVVTQGQLKDLNKFRGKQFDRIWVDEASMFDGLDSVLEIAVTSKARQIILIG